MRILLTTGGTAGHVEPELAVINEIKKKAKEKNIPLEFLWVGSTFGPEKELVEKTGVRYKSVLTGKIRRYFSFENFIDPFKIFVGILQSLWIVITYRPDVTFGKGGFVSFPAVFASWLLYKPILIHESDSIPGLTNKILGKLATKIALSFKIAKNFFREDKCVITGNPISREILFGDKNRGFERFNLDPEKPVLFITGGSQGAEAVNRIIDQCAPRLLKDCQILHQRGKGKLKPQDRKSPSYIAGYRQVEFLSREEMADSLTLATIIIARAGANSLFELASIGKPAIIIPLPLAAQDHQRSNAFYFQKKKAVVVFTEANLTPEILTGIIKDLLENKEKRRSLSENIKKLASENAVGLIADHILELGLKSRR